ncbi:MAG TPA: hypothetical protein VJ812_07045 [Gemmatimonadaceae bacterium]|jgi:hypothetical protein|nr:hypothetical protein [Gemmatimonadaceae bacterium]
MLVVLSFAACKSTGAMPAIAAQGSSRQTISVAELEGAAYPSLLEAVQALRGEWLRSRGPASVNFDRGVVIYLDGNRLGGPGMLRGIPTTTVVEVRFMNPPEAQSYFGLNHPHGAILVITKI